MGLCVYRKWCVWIRVTKLPITRLLSSAPSKPELFHPPTDRLCGWLRSNQGNLSTSACLSRFWQRVRGMAENHSRDTAKPCSSLSRCVHAHGHTACVASRMYDFIGHLRHMPSHVLFCRLSSRFRSPCASLPVSPILTQKTITHLNLQRRLNRALS